MRILVGIPCLLGASFIREAIESVLNNSKDVDLLLIDNGADQETKELISVYEARDNVHVIRNERNIYVNPAWNQIIEFFLYSRFDLLVIMNSDLILKSTWSDNLRELIKNNPNTSFAPIVINNKTKLEETPENNSIQYFEDGVAGVCIILTRKQAELIYPIPSGIKVWFGDNWIYDKLNKHGHKTAIAGNFIAYHSVSQTISRVEEIDKIIEQDKIEWKKIKDMI